MGAFLNMLTGMFDFELADCLESQQAGYLSRENGLLVLTASGKAAEKEWTKDPQRPNGRFIPVAQREFMEVSGAIQVAVEVDTFDSAHGFRRLGRL